MSSLRPSSIVLVCVISAACGSAGHAPPLPKPTGPAPSLSKHDDTEGDFRFHFESSGLPAVSADAGNVVFAVMDDLGPMSPPNLRCTSAAAFFL